ncbi:MAG: hypothetical protein HKN32_06450, partial [Flavobacteriales bacterium]|nr:hypothetical protein [Flavobacteriales bacterium]
MKRAIFMFLGMLCLQSTAWSQNELDALRYSMYDITGTARYIGMGGAFGALGADLTSLSQNPAGIAMYRRSEFGFTMGFGNTSATSSYAGGGLTSTDNSFGFNNMGMVGSYPTESEEIPRLNFGVAYNKLANFNEEFTIQGTVENTSLLDVFVAQANGVNPDDVTDAFPFSAGLAYQTYLINPLDSSGSNEYYHEIEFGNVEQTKSVERSGSMGETVLSGGVNVSDKYYFGLTLGFPSIRFEESSLYKEGNLAPGLELDNYTFRENLVTSGSGFNVKAGVIVRATNWMRLGAAIHSPTWLNMSEFYDRSMTSYFKGEEPYSWDSPAGEYFYRITTPARYMAN